MDYDDPRVTRQNNEKEVDEELLEQCYEKARQYVIANAAELIFEYFDGKLDELLSEIVGSYMSRSGAAEELAEKFWDSKVVQDLVISTRDELYNEECE